MRHRGEGQQAQPASRPALAGGAPAGIDWPQTLAARGSAALRAEHLRAAQRAPQAAALHCFVLDCSASMLAASRLSRAKGVLAELLAQAYRWRDGIAIVSFAGSASTVRVPPGRARPVSDAWLAPIGGGGGTPLAHALMQANTLLAAHRSGMRWLWLLTDGRTRESPPRPAHADVLRVIDFDDARVPLGRCAVLAQSWGAQHLAAGALGEPA